MNRKLFCKVILGMFLLISFELIQKLLKHQGVSWELFFVYLKTNPFMKMLYSTNFQTRLNISFMFLEWYEYSLNILGSQIARFRYSVMYNSYYISRGRCYVYSHRIHTGLAKLGPGYFLNDNHFIFSILFILWNYEMSILHSE